MAMPKKPKPDCTIEFSNGENDCACVDYTRLENGHGFCAADKKSEWLLVANEDFESALNEVFNQLNEIHGGIWQISNAEMVKLKAAAQPPQQADDNA